MTYKTKLTRGITLLLAATICTGALSGCSDAERPRDNDTEEQENVTEEQEPITEEQENDTALGGIFDSHIQKAPENDIQSVIVEDSDNDSPIALKEQTTNMPRCTKQTTTLWAG